MKKWLPAVLLSLVSSSVFAYGPIAVDTSGTPMRHGSVSSSSPLVWNPETGPLQDTTTRHEFDTDVVNSTSTENSAYQQLLTYCGLSSAGGRSLRNSTASSSSLISASISNTSGLGLIDAAWTVWQSVPTADLSFSQGPSLGEDVNLCNYFNYIETSMFPISSVNDVRVCGTLGTPGCTTSSFNAIVFDANGDIVAAEYGEANRSTLLGSAGPVVWSGYDGFIKMQALVNGVCLDDSPDTEACGSDTISTTDMKSILVHEFGHALGLSHSQVNLSSVTFASNGQATLNTAAGATSNDIVTMFPVLVRLSSGSQDNVDLDTLHMDDIAGISHLYPQTTYSSGVCTVSGTVYRNGTGLRCAEVVLRDTTTGRSKTHALSFITGSEKSNNGGTTASGCTEANSYRCGDYSISGLEPGKTYTIEVNAISPYFSEGSRVDPCDPPVSFDGSDASASATVTCTTGGTSVTGVEDADLLIVLPDSASGGGTSSGGCSLSEVSSSQSLIFLLFTVVFIPHIFLRYKKMGLKISSK